jgi:hypothetical protein
LAGVVFRFGSSFLDEGGLHCLVEWVTMSAGFAGL